MLAWLFDRGYVIDDCTLCFDGFLIPKASGVDKNVLKELEAEV